jgi:hypothetical protein
MPTIDGATLRAWRRSLGWDVPRLARELRRGAEGDHMPAHDSLLRQIRRWETGAVAVGERYELLYRKLGFTDAAEPAHARDQHQEDEAAVRRRTFVGLTGISIVDAILPPPAGSAADTEHLALLLTATHGGAPGETAPAGLPTPAHAVTRARLRYQACRYTELVSELPGLLGRLDTACRTLDGDEQLRACTLAADTYHVTAGFLLKTGDPGLAHLATDRSMKAARASEDPLTVGTSARILTHTLMRSGHLDAAIATATRHCAQLDRAITSPTPESQSVYGSILLRGAVAAAMHGARDTAHEMLAEAAGAARKLGRNANLRGTAFGPVNTQLHEVNIAVILGDAGTATDLARRIDIARITVTERRTTLLIDTARAFFMWGRYEQAYAALRAADDTAPEEVTTRPLVRGLVRDLVTLAPVSIRRDVEEFAVRIGVAA